MFRRVGCDSCFELLVLPGFHRTLEFELSNKEAGDALSLGFGTPLFRLRSWTEIWCRMGSEEVHWLIKQARSTLLTQW